MSETLKQYGGWILSGLLIGVVLYLVFRPVPVNDNQAAFKSIDSLTKINESYRKALTDVTAKSNIVIEDLNQKTDSLTATAGVLKFKNDVMYDEKLSLANQVKYYESLKGFHSADVHFMDGNDSAFDSVCDLLASKVIGDSLYLNDYENTTEILISDLRQGIGDRDSLITDQSNLIVSDSLLIKAQKGLNTVQQAELVKMTKRAKLNAWLARAGVIVIGALLISAATK